LLCELATKAPLRKRFDSLTLLGAIIASDDLVGVEAPPTEQIQRLLPPLRMLTEETMERVSFNTIAFIYLLQASAVFDGDSFWGPNLDRLSGGESLPSCPSCSHDLALVIGTVGCFTTYGEWYRRPDIKREPILPAERSALVGMGEALFTRAMRFDHPDVADW